MHKGRLVGNCPSQTALDGVCAARRPIVALKVDFLFTKENGQLTFHHLNQMDGGLSIINVSTIMNQARKKNATARREKKVRKCVNKHAYRKCGGESIVSIVIKVEEI